MPTDKERREVATRLRAIEPDDFSSYPEEHETVEKILGIWEKYDTYIWHHIADLIDPDGADPGPRDLDKAWGWK